MPQFSPTQTSAVAPRNKETMFPLIESYLKGHIRRSVFCHQHNLSINVFKYWQKKYKKAQKASSGAPSKPTSTPFVPVHVTPSPPAEQVSCELIFPNGVKLRFADPVTPQLLLQLIQGGA